MISSVTKTEIYFSQSTTIIEDYNLFEFDQSILHLHFELRGTYERIGPHKSLQIVRLVDLRQHPKKMMKHFVLYTVKCQLFKF